MFGFEIQIQLAKEKRREFLQAFEFLSCKSKECIGQHLYEDLDQDDRFLWTERWMNLTALEDHMRSDRFKSLLGAIDVLGELENLDIVEFRASPDDVR
ncbi:antibiotic biosynthesis monooxygenase family protein [Thermodesulfobacteriota bacterium]